MRLLVGVGAFAAGLAACIPHDPPAPDGNPTVAVAEVPTGATLTAAANPATTMATMMTTNGGAPTPVSNPDPALLPQTRDTPHALGSAFETRAFALWRAIVQDEPESAMPFFFPLGAYQQVKDVASPATDWKQRLVAAYARDIHALHARLAVGGTRATFVAMDVPDARARWIEPGEEYNKIGYFRVFGSKLRYEDEGAARTFDIKSLISWRGEWYVVHLSAVK